MRGWTILAAAWLLLLTGCGGPAADPGETEPVTRQIFAMDTLMQFSLYGDGAGEAVQAAADTVERLDAALSRLDPDSQVSRLNSRAGERTEVSGMLGGLVAFSREYTERTEGCFDITVAPVMDAWGFTTEEPRVPDAAELEALLPLVDSGRITLESGEDGNFLTLAPGQAIDLGGIAKGYATDCLAEIFAQRDAERGWVSLGGNVLVWGTRPDGEPWRVGVQDPRQPDQAQNVGEIRLEDAFAVTSGGYQRYFEADGTVYHHVVDPATGRPADSGLLSVTVIAPAEPTGALDGEGLAAPGNGAMCDALSTALFVMGEERAVDFWRESGRAFDLVLVTEDGRVVTTAGIAESFTPQAGSAYSYETVS